MFVTWDPSYFSFLFVQAGDVADFALQPIT